MLALQYVELDVDYCSRVYGVSPCVASLMMAGVAAPQAIDFDGLAYLTRGAALTGAANSAKWTFSSVFRFNALPAAPMYLLGSATAIGGATLRTNVVLNPSGALFVSGYNAAGAQCLLMGSSILEPGRWYHVLSSADISANPTLNSFLYINDVNDRQAFTLFGTDTIGLATAADWSIGGTPAGAGLWNGDIAELWSDGGVAYDLSVVANRRKFISAAKQPVALGAAGQTPTGASPDIYLSGDPTTWSTNKGTGGGFTTHGAIAATPSEVGLVKCFQTQITCQDRPNFNNVPATLRFAIPTEDLPDTIPAIPSIKSIEFEPATISLGATLGQRATLTITFNDHLSSDTGPGFDKYVAERPYVPFLQGTFFGKFRARHAYLVGRPLRWIIGALGDALADMEIRHYIVDSISGPTAAGQFTIVAKDILKLADGDKALAPAANTGFLVADITDTATSLTLSPAGIGNTEYPASGKLNIGGKEIVSFQRDPLVGNDANTLLLLHFDGANNDTATTDSSSFARAVTRVNGTVLDTAQKQFGTTSARLTVNGYWTLPDSNDWTFAGDFTIDTFFMVDTLTNQRAVCGHGSALGVQYRLIISVAGVLTFEVLNTGTVVTLSSGAGAVVVDVLYHLTIERFGNVWTLFINGAAVATVTSAAAIPNYAGTFKVGGDGNGSSNVDVAWVDEFRVSRVARYRGAPFASPVAAYQTSGDIVTITARGQNGTVASAHSAQDLAQVCLEYIGADPADIVADLLSLCPGMPAGYVQRATYKAETAAYLNRLYSGIVPSPTSIATLLSEICEQAGLSIWDNDRDQVVGFLVLRGILSDALQLTDSNMIAGSLEITDQPDLRLTQVHVYFGQINPLTSLTDTANYRSKSITIATQAEIDFGVPAIKQIFSRWIPAFGRSIADRIGTILINRFEFAPRHFKLNLLRGSVPEIVLARGYQIGSFALQDATGAPALVPAQVTRLKPDPALITLEADEIRWNAPAEDLSAPHITIDAGILNVNFRSAYDLIYPAPVAGNTITCTINAGVIVGSALPTLHAFEVGTWPAGVNLILNVLGRIEGAGGAGGDPVGHAGGTALYTRQAITVNVGTGQIWSGGGGGGRYDTAAGGSYIAGGGAGSLPGLGSGGATGSFAGTTEAGGGSQSPAGAGGGPGLHGVSAAYVGFPADRNYAGGAAGPAIDGVSHITIGTGPGDIRGSQVN